ncbi:MAG TPA: cysteine hydrolase family protein [Candidatus Obscuribacterales bacterium]
MATATSLLDIIGAPAKPAKFAQSAIVVVDAQREYLDGSVPLSGIEDALVEIQKLLARGRALSVPIFHVAHYTQPGAPIFNPDSPMSDIIDAVRPVGDEPVVKKHLPSAFVNTDLEKYLKKTGRKEVVIAGFMTHMCINATTRSAVDLGYAPTIIASACATRDLPSPDGKVVSAETVHRTNLASLADLLACVCSTSDELS